MKKDIIRTTAFALPPALLGYAYRLPAQDGFRERWRELRTEYQAIQKGKSSPHRTLPYASLVTALTISTGDFVCLRIGRADSALLSRAPITPAVLRRTFIAWEQVVFGRSRGLGEYFAAEPRRYDLADLVEERPGGVPQLEPWAWDAIRWNVTHLLAASPLQDEYAGVRDLRISTDTGEPSLLTWAVPLRGRGNDMAMLELTPRVITLPGHAQMILDVGASMMRVARTMDTYGRAKSAVVDVSTGAPLINVKIGRVRDGESWGDFRPTNYDGEVLRRLHAFPELNQAEIEAATHVRLRWWKPQGRDSSIGKGVNQLTLDLVARHARKQLEDHGVSPLVFRAKNTNRTTPDEARRQVTPETLDAAIEASDRERFRMIVLYTSDATRAAVLNALKEVLASTGWSPIRVADDSVVKIGRLELVFRRVSQGHEFLLACATAAEIRTSVLPIIKRDTESATIPAVLVEIADPAQLKPNGELEDPYAVLKRTLPRGGALVQFLVHRGDAPDEMAAKRAVWDLFRSAGMLPRRNPPLSRGEGRAAYFVGSYAVRVRGKWNQYLTGVVAVQSDGYKAMAWTRERTWLPLGRATLEFHRTEAYVHGNDVAEFHRGALQALTNAHLDAKVVWFPDATGLRAAIPSLQDGTWHRSSSAFVRGIDTVRVRATGTELPGLAGEGTWDAPGRGIKGRKLLLGAMNDLPGYALWAAPPPVVVGKNRPPELLTASRLACNEIALSKDWQSYNPVEFAVHDSSELDRDVLIELAVSLCRNNPTWQEGRSTNLPAPLHLARAMVRDHPLFVL